MSVQVAATIFFVMSVIYVILVDIFTAIFIILAVPKEISKFQVISLLTNCGYTNKECDLILNVPQRRKVAKIAMICGYFFAVTIITLFVNVLLVLPHYEADKVWPALIILCSSFLLFLIIKHIPKVKKFFDIILYAIAQQYIYISNENIVIPLEYNSNGVIAKVTLKQISQNIENVIKSEDVKVLIVEKSDGTISDFTENLKLEVNDALIVIGNEQIIKDLFTK